MFVLRAMRVAAATLIRILFKKINLSFFREKIFLPTYKRLDPPSIFLFRKKINKKKESLMDSLYHEIKLKSGAKAARVVAREILKRNNGNVLKTAYILGTSRLTVRRARDGNLEDEPKTP